MILLDSKEILDAVGRSLETHVLPRLEDDFARVQVLSALKALAEVADRFENGDACDAMNANIQQGVRDIAERVRGDAPAFAEALEQALAAAPADAPAREWNRRVCEALWSLIQRREHDACAEVLELLREQAKLVVAGDGRWMCPEAIASLT